MLLSFVYQHLNFQWKLISWQYTWPEVQRPWDRVYSAADLYNLLAKVLQVGMISWTVGFYDVPYHGSERFLEFIYNSGMSHSSPSLYMEKKSLMTSTGRIPCSCGTTEKFISAYDTSVGFFNSFLWFSYLREHKKITERQLIQDFMEMELEFSSFWGGGWGENLQYHTEEKKKPAYLWK